MVNGVGLNRLIWTKDLRVWVCRQPWVLLDFGRSKMTGMEGDSRGVVCWVIRIGSQEGLWVWLSIRASMVGDFSCGEVK